VIAAIPFVVLTALPLAVVEQAPGCPDEATLTEELARQLEESTAGGTTLRLRVGEDGAGVLHVELVDDAGRVVLSRDVDGTGATCASRARSIAVVVERFVAGLAAPGSRAHPPRAASTARPWLGVQVGLSFPIGVDPALAFAGVALGASLRPTGWSRLVLDGALHLPQRSTSDAVSVLRGLVRLRAVAVIGAGAFEVEAGASARADLTSVSIDAPRESAEEWRVAPGVGLPLAGHLTLGQRSRVGLAIEPWVALDGQVFHRSDDVQTVLHETPPMGLHVELLASHDFL
jgi:hypothetical protein